MFTPPPFSLNPLLSGCQYLGEERGGNRTGCGLAGREWIYLLDITLEIF